MKHRRLGTLMAETWLRQAWSRGRPLYYAQEPCCSAAPECIACSSATPWLACGQAHLGTRRPVMPPRVGMTSARARACAASERAAVWELRSALHETPGASPAKEPRCPTAPVVDRSVSPSVRRSVTGPSLLFLATHGRSAKLWTSKQRRKRSKAPFRVALSTP